MQQPTKTFGQKMLTQRPEAQQCPTCHTWQQPISVGRFWILSHCDCNKKMPAPPVESQRPRNLKLVKSSDHGMSRLSESFETFHYVAKPKPQPHQCSYCGQIVEPYELPTGSWKPQHCECELAFKRHMEDLTTQWYDFLRQRQRCYGGWLGSRYKDNEVVAEMLTMTFESWDNLFFEDAIKKANAFVENPTSNMIVYSNSFGTGKTHLAAAISNLLALRGMPSTYASMPQFWDAYFTAMFSRNEDKTNLTKIQECAIGVPLLILDEVENESRQQVLDAYYLILNERYRKHRPTILITNHLNDLQTTIGAKLYSRLCSNVIEIEMEGTDYRLMEDREEKQASRNMLLRALRTVDLMDQKNG